MFAEHVGACEACAAELGTLRTGWVALDAVPEIAPRRELRNAVLAAVAAAREHEAAARTTWRSALRFLLPAIGAALASAVVLVLPDPDCRTPLAVAFCSVLWAGVYALAFAVLLGSQRQSPSRAVVVRGVGAAAAGMLLVTFCPDGAGQTSPLPLLGAAAAAAAASPVAAFALGLGLAAVPLALAVLLVPPSGPRPRVGRAFGTAGLYFALLAPALYLVSSFLAVGGLVALLVGAAVGALAPVLLELPLRQPVAESA